MSKKHIYLSILDLRIGKKFKNSFQLKDVVYGDIQYNIPFSIELWCNFVSLESK